MTEVGLCQPFNTETAQPKSLCVGVVVHSAHRMTALHLEHLDRCLHFQIPANGCRVKHSFFMRAIMPFQFAVLQQCALINREHSAITEYLTCLNLPGS